MPDNSNNFKSNVIKLTDRENGAGGAIHVGKVFSADVLSIGGFYGQILEDTRSSFREKYPELAQAVSGKVPVMQEEAAKGLVEEKDSTQRINILPMGSSLRTKE